MVKKVINKKIHSIKKKVKTKGSRSLRKRVRSKSIKKYRLRRSRRMRGGTEVPDVWEYKYRTDFSDNRVRQFHHAFKTLVEGKYKTEVLEKMPKKGNKISLMSLINEYSDKAIDKIYFDIDKGENDEYMLYANEGDIINNGTNEMVMTQKHKDILKDTLGNVAINEWKWHLDLEGAGCTLKDVAPDDWMCELFPTYKWAPLWS